MNLKESESAHISGSELQKKTQVVLLVVQSERIGHVLSICPYGIQISARPGRCFCSKGCGNSHKECKYA